MELAEHCIMSPSLVQEHSRVFIKLDKRLKLHFSYPPSTVDLHRAAGESCDTLSCCRGAFLSSYCHANLRWNVRERNKLYRVVGRFHLSAWRINSSGYNSFNSSLTMSPKSFLFSAGEMWKTLLCSSSHGAWYNDSEAIVKHLVKVAVKHNKSSIEREWKSLLVQKVSTQITQNSPTQHRSAAFRLHSQVSRVAAC